MRKSTLGKDAEGITAAVLNNKPLFQFGPLDQGFWPDGLYTAPTDEALRYDIEVTKKLGFNMVRKHVKVEPERWYYWCDKLGLLVWQDMPSTVVRGARSEDSDAAVRGASSKAMIDERRNHPCIVMWVPFNEGWGQYDTPRIAQWIEAYDPTGWSTTPAAGPTPRRRRHRHPRYPGPGAPPTEPSRAAVLGEFGGLGLPLAGHTWQTGELGLSQVHDAGRAHRRLHRPARRACIRCSDRRASPPRSTRRPPTSRSKSTA